MSRGRGRAMHAREHVCLSLLPPLTDDDPGKQLQQGTRERIQMLQLSFEVDDIAHICETPLHMFLTSPHTLASSVDNDKETEHSHESEGLEKCEVCVRVCVCNVHSQHMATEAKYSLSTAGSCFLLLTLDPSQSGSLFSLLPSNMLSSSHLPLLGVLLIPLHFSLSPFFD